MHSTCTVLSNVSEESEQSDSTRQTNDCLSLPVIDMEPFDDIPFSESFSGLFGLELNHSTRLANDMSYNVDRITDIQGLDSDWDDDDIDEIVVISRKPTIHEALIDIRDRKKFLEHVFSLSEFDFTDRRIESGQTIVGTHTIRKRDTNRVYTMKAFPATPSLNWPFELRLLEMLTELDCPFIPYILRRIFEHQSLFVLLDSYPAGNMLNYVLQDGALDPDEVLFYSSEIAEAISVLHDAKIQHRGIEPTNVMIYSDGHIVLSGFELARFDGQEFSSIDQRVPRDYEYRAPEVLLRWEHDQLVDCWGLGCIIYFMTFGEVMSLSVYLYVFSSAGSIPFP
ncbi:kinase-like domain-containing protein [Rhodocollybia butyracea]|uniref:Kinase-like domain-containing protein n=1 Tax=Rhodocollybia butyracea TaxID=206335 RepID=A0A9P5PWV8_9AGAR|nr:kinase-like domain-containing protein [Rhodocollybia butyracea]